MVNSTIKKSYDPNSGEPARISIDEAIRYASEVLENDEVLALLRDQIANPPVTEDELEDQQSDLSRVAHDYALSKGLHFQFTHPYFEALRIAKEVVRGRWSTPDNQEVRDILKNSNVINAGPGS